MTTLIERITQTVNDNMVKFIASQEDGIELWEAEHVHQTWTDLPAHINGSGHVGPMTFPSILFKNAEDYLKNETVDSPDFFRDLNLDQIVEAITARKEEYDLKPFFYTPLPNVEAIRYRHEVMLDMEDASLMAHINAFAEKMIVVRRYLALIKKLDFNTHKKGWFLEAALVYCDAVTNLAHDLHQANLKSPGFLAFQQYVTNYAHSPAFELLQTEAQAVKGKLSGIRYSVIIRPGKFSVRKYDRETDYTVEVEQVFEKFKQGAVNDYRLKLYEQAQSPSKKELKRLLSSA